MGQPPLSDELAQQAIDAVAQAGWNITKASIALDIPRQTLESRYNTAKRRKLKARVRVRATSEPTVATPTVPSGDASADLEVRRLRSTIETLRADLKAQRRAELDHHIVREQILGLTAETPTPPEWVLNAHEADEGPGVPMTLWSDWHWGEVVRAEEVGGVNEFNIEIAHARARRLVEKIISLSFSHAVNPTYPGIVVMLGGDMISGEIHDEITETNEMRTAPALIDLQGVLIEALTHMADRFGRVFVPCVVGNHGRMTHKPRAKGRVHCLDVATPILTRDLNWVAAGDLAEGQGLLAFDDEAPPTQRQGRSLQSAAVTRNARVVAPTLRIELANGDVLFATHEHKFLARTGANVSHRWISAEQMSRRYTENNSEGGRPVKYYLPRYMRTWERVDTYEAGYLAGAFDADGCLQTVNGSGLQVQLSQYDNALLARARDCLETLGFQYTDRVVVNEWGKDQHIVTVVGGLPETLRFLGSVRPPRLLAKWMAFDVAQRRFWAREMFEVVSVTDGGEREIAEITSSAGTYISAGYGSHNTSFEWLMYCQLERHFRDDPRFRFMIPGEADAHFPVAGQRVMLTHGDSLGTRGGDGMIGPLGPITRGIIKTRNSEAQIGRDFDFCCMGHWHQWMPLHDRGFVVNGCFPPGQPVLLADAQEKPIEAVSVGDMVVTHTGNVRPVVDRMERNHHGEIVHFRVGTETSDVRCTPNHKVWAVKGSQTSLWLPVNGGWEKVGTGRPEPSWIPAEYLSIGDYISAPAPMESTPYGLGDAAFFRLIGLYVAEGSASGRDGRLDHLDFSLHRNEEAIADFIVEQCRRRWGSGEHVLPNGRPNSRSVACYRGAAATEMAALGGRGSKTKALSAAVMTAPPDLQVEVLLGWLAGDGHTAKASYRGGRYVSGTSVSRALIMQMRQIALRCGMRPHVYLLRAGGPRKSDSWTLGFMREDAERLGAQLDEPVTPSKRQIAHASIDVGGKAFYRITHVWRTDYDGPVHNLTVADDHSYVVNGWGVKNSLKGYDEFARLFLRARYERPIQGLWFMHPRVGVTSVWPIYLEPMPRHASVDPALPFAA